MEIDNFFERSLSLLASQFRDFKPDGSLTNLQKLIKVLSAPFQEIADVIQELKTERWLSTAIGQQLDEIGIILGLPRNPNESDEAYRQRLQFQVYINIYSGTPEQLMNILKNVTNASYVGYLETEFAYFQLETNGLTFPTPINSLNQLIKDSSPAGVNYAPIVLTYNMPIVFSFGDDVTDVPLNVAPNENDPLELHELEVEPYNSILYVANGYISDDNFGEGGLAELNYPSEDAGSLAEVLQINGNFPARR